MKNQSSQNPNSLLRLAAFPLAFLCLWMATVGVIDHTDDFQIGSSRSSRVVWHQAGPVTPGADTCAACSWLAAMQTSSPALAPAVLPYLFSAWLFPIVLTGMLAPSLLRTGSRAPPRLP